MRTSLQVAAFAIAIATTALWFFGGPNWGWTKTSILEKRLDPVTELEAVVILDRFVPGVDFLAAGLVASAFLAGVSLLLRQPKKSL